MNASKRYEQWTGAVPAGCLPRRPSKRKDANPIVAPILAEVVGDHAAVLSARARKPAAAAPGRLGGLDASTASAKALSLNKRKAIALPLRQARQAFERAYFEQLLARESVSLARVAEESGLERTLKALGIKVGKKGDSP